MNLRSKIKNIFLAGVATVGISSCVEDPTLLYTACSRDRNLPFEKEDPSEVVSRACTIEDAETSKIGRVWFDHPPEYKEDLQKFYSFILEDFSNHKENLGLLEQVIFYNPIQQSCKDEYGGVSKRLFRVMGFTNAVNYIFLNDFWDIAAFGEDAVGGRKAYFGYLIGGQHHVLAHELGHLQLERYYDYTPEKKELIDEITPFPCHPCYGFENEYMAERYAHFVQIAFARTYPEEFAQNNFFAENVLPYLEQLSQEPEKTDKLTEEIERWRNLVDKWDDSLYDRIIAPKEYHDKLYAFFKDEVHVISPDFHYDLSFDAIAPFMQNLVAQQQERAHQQLDLLEEMLP
ncbi:hypothetical protein HYX13_02620 [Candidatus Woesearchaeota archaeon]|nr:hypothetical protein [Candidatus Woesearchaeota archaeon]